MRRRIGLAVMSALILASMAGCGNSAESKADTTTDNSAADNNAAVSADSEQDAQAAEESGNENNSASVSGDIINADLSSGLVQICGDVFKNGGYMTVNEFISAYGDKYDVSSIDVQKEVEEDWYFCYSLTNKTSGEEVEIFCREPVSGSGVAGDGVIVMFYESNASYPSGIGRMNQMEESDIISFYEANGCTFSESSDDKSKPLYERFPAAKNAGKYTQYKTDTANIIVAAVELDSENLYGETPKLLYSYEDYNEENSYFKVWEVNYKGSESAVNN